MKPYCEAITATHPIVKLSWLVVLTIFGKNVAVDGVYGREACVEDRVLGVKVFKAIQTYLYLGCGLVDTYPVKPGARDWAGVVKDVDQFKTKSLLGQKLICVV
jgi:hypothetical protein